MSDKYLTSISLPNGEVARVGIPIFGSLDNFRTIASYGQIGMVGRSFVENISIKEAPTLTAENLNSEYRDPKYTFNGINLNFYNSTPQFNWEVVVFFANPSIQYFNQYTATPTPIPSFILKAQDGVLSGTFYDPDLTLEDYGEYGVTENDLAVGKYVFINPTNGSQSSNISTFEQLLESRKYPQLYIFEDETNNLWRQDPSYFYFSYDAIPFEFYMKGKINEIKIFPLSGIVANSKENLPTDVPYNLPLGSRATVYSKGAELRPTEVKGVSDKDVEDYSAFIGNGGNADDYEWNYDIITNMQIDTSKLPTISIEDDISMVVYFMTPDEVMTGAEIIKYCAVFVSDGIVSGVTYVYNINTGEEILLWDKVLYENGSWNYANVSEFNNNVNSLNATTGMLIDDGTDLSILNEFVVLTSNKEVCTDYRLKERGWVKDSIDTTAIGAKIQDNTNKIQENTDTIKALQIDVDDLTTGFENVDNRVTKLSTTVEENSDYIKKHKDEYYWLNKSVVGVFDELEEVKAKVDDFLPADYLIQMAQADGRLMCHDEAFGQVGIMTSNDSYTTFLTRGGGCVITQPIQAVWSTYKNGGGYSGPFQTPNYIDVIYSLPTPYYADDGTVDASGLFAGMSNLKRIDSAIFDHYAAKITGARRMFYNCKNLRPLNLQMDLPNLESVEDMFYQSCTVNAGYDENARIKIVCNFSVMRNADRMFYDCAPMSIDLSQSQMPMVETADEMFYQLNTYGNPGTISLPTMPKIVSINRMFYNSDVSTISSGLQNCSNVTDITHAFYGCTTLTNLPTGFLGGLKISVSFADCSKLTRESILNVINAVADLSTEGKTATLTLHATAKARLTANDIAIATAKGWTIA